MNSQSASDAKTVLVINPQRSLARELESTLTRFGYRAMATSNWRKGLRWASEHKPDLLCIEVATHGKDGGIALAEQIWREHGIPTVFLADASTVAKVEQVSGSHLLDFLAKPFDEEQLHCTLELAFRKMSQTQEAEKRTEKMAAELQTMQNQLIQAQKMEVVGSFTAGIAHDFNNVLLPILGYSSLLSESLQDNPKLKELADQIHHAGQSASALTRQLLSFSRKKENEREVLDLHQVIKSTKMMLTRLLGEEYKLDLNFEREALYASVDQGQIEQVLMNLCINARDAMDPGGKITIATRKLNPQDDEIQAIQEIVQGDWMCLSVQDEGFGMTDETLEHLFEAFYSTKDGEGTGLGLSVVHGIVTQHDGHITVTSEIGEGSEFRIYLPLQNITELKATEPAEQQQPAAKQNGSESILLIEDEPRVRTFVTKALTNRGYQVSTAEDLKTAEQLLRQSRQDDGESSFDLIFSDCVLPDGNGAEFVERELPNLPNVKALLTTGYAEGEHLTETASNLDIAFLQKPYPLTKLLEVIRDILEEEEGEEPLAKAS